MRCGHNDAEQEGMASCASRANEVRRHDGFTVPGLERVQCSQAESNQRGGEKEPYTDALGRYQLREGAARRCLPIISQAYGFGQGSRGDLKVFCSSGRSRSHWNACRRSSAARGRMTRNTLGMRGSRRRAR